MGLRSNSVFNELLVPSGTKESQKCNFLPWRNFRELILGVFERIRQFDETRVYGFFKLNNLGYL